MAQAFDQIAPPQDPAQEREQNGEPLEIQAAEIQDEGDLAV